MLQGSPQSRAQAQEAENAARNHHRKQEALPWVLYITPASPVFTLPFLTLPPALPVSFEIRYTSLGSQIKSFHAFYYLQVQSRPISFISGFNARSSDQTTLSFVQNRITLYRSAAIPCFFYISIIVYFRLAFVNTFSYRLQAPSRLSSDHAQTIPSTFPSHNDRQP